MKKRTTSHQRAAYGRGGPRTYGRPHVPTIPVPAPFLAAAALLAAFALGRTSARKCAGPPHGAAGCAPRREKEPPAGGEETLGA